MKRGFPLNEFGKGQYFDSTERTRAYVAEQSQYVHNEKLEPIATGNVGPNANDNLMYNPVKSTCLQTLPTPMLNAEAAEFNSVQSPNVTLHNNEASAVTRPMPGFSARSRYLGICPFPSQEGTVAFTFIQFQ